MINHFEFSGKRALIVGGSSGIGNATAQALRSCGASVHVWGTRPGPADYSDSADSDLAGLHYAQVDVADRQRMQTLEPGFDGLDVLVLSQGMVLYDRAEFEPAGFRQVVEVNLNSVMDCCTRFHPMLKASKGSIVIISSVVAFQSARGNPAYAASKTGAMGLTRTLGDAWATDGVRVNGVAPGLVPTKMTKATTDHPRRLEAMVSQIPLGRPGTAPEIASAVLFLASPMASYMVGQTLVVDGGMSLR